MSIKIYTTTIIINRCNINKTPIYVATNLLESMIHNPIPTRAEINDIMNTLLDGANGLVLAAETAIGENPIKCVAMVNRVIDSFNDFPPNILLEDKVKFLIK